MVKIVQDHIEQRLFDNAKDVGDLTPTNALPRFNRYMHKVEDKVAQFVMEDFFDEWISMNLIAHQNEYDLPVWDSDNPWIPWIPEVNKLLEVSIKYKDWTWSWKKATLMNQSLLNHPLEWYKTNQPASTPLFRFDNKKIRIYPEPTENVTDWLIIRYARTNVDVELSTEESDLSLPRKYIPVILDGMSYQLHKTNKDVQVMEFYKKEWEQSLDEMLTDLWDRYIQPQPYRNPNLSNMMY